MTHDSHFSWIIIVKRSNLASLDERALQTVKVTMGGGRESQDICQIFKK